MTTVINIAAVHPRMGSPEMPWPARETAQAADWDCVAAIDKPLRVWPGRVVNVPLGFALSLPDGWQAQLRPRSSLGARGLIMPNSLGTVDANCCGEVSALLYMLPLSPYRDGEDDDYVPLGQTREIVIQPGERICQLVIAQVPAMTWERVPREQLSPAARGDRSLGPTGR